MTTPKPSKKDWIPFKTKQNPLFNSSNGKITALKSMQPKADKMSMNN